MISKSENLRALPEQSMSGNIRTSQLSFHADIMYLRYGLRL